MIQYLEFHERGKYKATSIKELIEDVDFNPAQKRRHVFIVYDLAGAFKSVIELIEFAQKNVIEAVEASNYWWTCVMYDVTIRHYDVTRCYTL